MPGKHSSHGSQSRSHFQGLVNIYKASKYTADIKRDSELQKEIIKIKEEDNNNMKNNQKGFAPIIIAFIVALVIGGGYFIVKQQENKKPVGEQSNAKLFIETMQKVFNENYQIADSSKEIAFPDLSGGSGPSIKKILKGYSFIYNASIVANYGSYMREKIGPTPAWLAGEMMMGYINDKIICIQSDATPGLDSPRYNPKILQRGPEIFCADLTPAAVVQTSTTNQPVATQPAPTTPANTQNYVEVKELGFKIPVDASMVGELTYKINSGDGAVFSSKALTATSKFCGDGASGAGIAKIQGTPATPKSGDPLFYKAHISDTKQFDGFFLFYQGPQDSCTGGKNVDLEKKVYKAVADGFKNAAVTDETENWKTYTDANMGVSVKYPSSWTYQEFSCNIDGVAFCPLAGNSLLNCKQTCGMNSPESPIYLYTGKTTAKTDLKLNSTDYEYKKIYDQMLSTFKFTSPANSTTQSKPSITVLSPNGGESYQQGQQIPVKWTYSNLPGVNTRSPELIENISIKVISQNGATCEVVSNIPVITTDYSINHPVGQGCYPLAPGIYRISLEVGLPADVGVAEDSSNSYFTITK